MQHLLDGLLSFIAGLSMDPRKTWKPDDFNRPKPQPLSWDDILPLAFVLVALAVVGLGLLLI